MRLIVGMTGATGAVLGVRLLEELHRHEDVETHLVISRWARATIEFQTGLSTRRVGEPADVVYSPDDQGAATSSGSFPTDGMVIVPCSMKTLPGIRTGYAEGLVARAADVTIKEHRRLVVVPRETPLSEIHLENMLALARMGAAIVPPMPAFYNHPATVSEIVDHVVARICDQFGIESSQAKRWGHARRGVLPRLVQRRANGDPIMTRYKDLREYIAALDEIDDIKHVGHEVSWDPEAAAYTRLSYERTAPAPLFENVAGVAPGFRLPAAPPRSVPRRADRSPASHCPSACPST
jgi:4-hydroxy-3-polyprenylbenzoate decarboxylase